MLYANQPLHWSVVLDKWLRDCLEVYCALPNDFRGCTHPMVEGKYPSLGVLPKDIHYMTIYNINNTKVNLINNLDP